MIVSEDVRVKEKAVTGWRHESWLPVESDTAVVVDVLFEALQCLLFC